MSESRPPVVSPGTTKAVEVARTVDACGKVCPLPILLLAKALRALPGGAVVELVATDPAMDPDVRAYCAATGCELIELRAEGRLRRAFIRKVTA